MAEPILVLCEGSGCPTHHFGFNESGICSMCGEWVLDEDGVAEPHERKDILAMIDRGDFGR